MVTASARAPSYWTGPTCAKVVRERHAARRSANARKGAPSSSTSALRITGLSLPLRRSMASMAVSGTPFARHSVGGWTRPCKHAITPVHSWLMRAAAVRPRA